jgi:hypothetical protein
MSAKVTWFPTKNVRDNRCFSNTCKAFWMPATAPACTCWLKSAYPNTGYSHNDAGISTSCVAKSNHASTWPVSKNVAPYSSVSRRRRAM